MFNRTIAAKTFAACALTALLAASAACSSSNDSDNNKGAASSTTGASSVTQAVTDTYVRFFDGKTSADQKIALLENGAAFADTIKAQANSPMAKSTSAQVTNVASTSTDHADVTFTVLFNGTPALSGQQGSAVFTDGTWKVTSSTFCALLTLEGAAPPVCGAAASSPGATPAPGAPTASPAPGAPSVSPAPGTPTIVPAPTS